MTMAGGHRRIWRWAAVTWALVVAGGGGVTLWLRAGAEPREPYVWQRTQDASRTPPAAHGDGHGCPRSASAAPETPSAVPVPPSAVPPSMLRAGDAYPSARVLPSAVPGGPDFTLCVYTSVRR
ncbi:hypothetical protein ACWEKM_14750 [Streptomyces sp. NPDC004752]